MQKAKFDTTINTTMYLKKLYSPATRLTRKQWARRKHTHNWLAHSNVLKDWACSYRFHKNYTKLVHQQFFTKNSFLAFNVVAAQNSIPALCGGSASLLTGTFTRRILKYFQLQANPRFAFLRFFKNARMLAVSYYAKEDNYLSIKDNLSVVPLFTDSLTSALPYDHAEISQHAIVSCYKLVAAVPLSILLAQLLAIYRTLVILTSLRLL